MLQMNGATLKQVEKFKYLGVAFTSDARQDEELDTRIGKASAIVVARIFDWGGPKPQITCNDILRNFQKRNFLLGKDIVEWKI